MLTPAPIEVALPEALHAVIVKAIIARKGSHIVSTFLAFIWVPLTSPVPLLRFDDLPVGRCYKHRFVRESVTSSMHIFEAFEAKVIFAIRTEYLWLFDGAGGARTAVSCRYVGVVFARPLCILMQTIPTRLAKSHEALIALQYRLHYTARLTWNLQIPELNMEKHVWLAKQKTVHRRLRTNRQQV
jgi:hypothetical protein